MTQIIPTLERIRTALESCKEEAAGEYSGYATLQVFNECKVEQALADMPALIDAVKELQQDNDAYQENNIGYLVIATIANNLEQHKWEDEWHDFYKSDQWIGSHRAASALLTEKFRELQANYDKLHTICINASDQHMNYIGSTQASTQLLQAKLDAEIQLRHDLEAKLVKALAEPTEAEVVLAANQVVSFVDLARIALTGFINARRGK